MSDADDRLVGAVLDVAGDPRLRLGSLADVASADAVLVLGEDLTNTAPMLDLTIRTWLHLRPSEVEERNHIRRWNDAAITRLKRREPSALWIATTHATKLDEIAAAALARSDRTFNPQQQFSVTWQDAPVVALAYVDQLARERMLDASLEAELRAALAEATGALEDTVAAEEDRVEDPEAVVDD